jgi:hypothetical protein
MSATDQLRRQLNVAIMNYCHQRPSIDQKLQFRLCLQATAEVMADLVTSASKNNPEVARDLVRQAVRHMAERMEGKR